MLLYFTHKSHTGPPLRYVPVIDCKGRNFWGNKQILGRKYFKIGYYPTCQWTGTWHQYLASLNEQETLNKIKNNYFVTILL